MAEDKMAHLTAGPISRNSIVEQFVAGAASLKLWMPVKITAAATTTSPATVNVTATGADPLVIGVLVGGANMDAENGYANKDSGDLVLVCTFGPCKCYVDGGTANIVLGDGLVSDVTSGYGIKGTYATDMDAVFAMALMAATEDGDIIEVYVGKVGTLA
jgi:hypothetical protein